MNKLFILIAISCGVLFFSSPATAREYEKNPDRFPSIGLTYESFGLEGETDFRGVAKQDVEESGGAIIFDWRMPLSQSITMNLALGAIGSLTEGVSMPQVTGYKTELGGGYFRLGMRYYFNGGGKRRESF